MCRYVGILVIAVVVGLAAGGATARADGSPCGFDLFILSNGQARDLTNTPFACEFNPDWSINRGQVVSDHNSAGQQQDLFLTDVSTGVSTPLVGGDGGNNGSWAPNGQMIAFDRLGAADATVYVVPSSGGVRRTVVSDAVDTDWAPNSQRLVFSRPSDGSIGTVDLAGGNETIVAPPGSQSSLGCIIFTCGVVWAPDGNSIAYSDGQNIWSVRVTLDGTPLGAPVLVSAGGPFFESQPSWTGDSMSIVFTSDRAGDGGAALWIVPASGGIPQRLNGPTSMFSYDPSVARGGGAIVYSGSTP